MGIMVNGFSSGASKPGANAFMKSFRIWSAKARSTIPVSGRLAGASRRKRGVLERVVSGKD